MNYFICPVCRKILHPKKHSLFCPNGHTFDVSRDGYVNLLLSTNQKTKQHGDDKLMVQARHDFLNKGFYDLLLDNIANIVASYATDDCTILDIGCGECYFTSGIHSLLLSQNLRHTFLAFDISKEAIKLAAKQENAIKLTVASAYNIPILSDSCEIMLSIFSPFCEKEVMRLLKNYGYLIKVVPLESHLWQLKQCLYDKPYLNEIKINALDGFEIISSYIFKDTIAIKSAKDIWNLFCMTPYYHKTRSVDCNRLRHLPYLEVNIEFGVLVYRKQLNAHIENV